MSYLKNVSLCAVAALLMATLGGDQASSADPAPKVAATPSTTASNATTETVSRTVEDGGTGPYKAILVGDSSLTTHTIFRPKDLSVFSEKKKLPIISWGNGACANSSQGYQNFLSEVASHGYLVIAIGPAQTGGARARGAGARAGGAGGGGSGTKSSQLLDAVEWATAQNANKASIYYNKIDTSKIAVLGHSCGGLQALEVSSDPRISTTVVCDSGILNTSGGRGGLPGMPGLSKEHLAKLHSPVLYLLGGSSDIAYGNGTDDFRRIEKLPAFMANMDVGHGGTYGRPHGGEFAKVAVAWFDWQLKDDKEAAKMFTGQPCGLSNSPNWKVEKKNIP
jgi:dienelactone hydrolase